MARGIRGLLSVRAGPQPDPLPAPRTPGWKTHAPWATAAAAVLLCELTLTHGELGLLACGAALCAIALQALQGRLRETGHALHLAGGVFALTLFHGAEAAGAYVLPAGLILVATLAGAAVFDYVSPAVAPLAGRVPWRFTDIYRKQAQQFALVGLMASLFLVLVGPTPVWRVLGVALLPLSLRSYACPMLSPGAAEFVWSCAGAVQTAVLLLFVPSQGPIAAAWGVVVAETLLFVGAALAIADRTGEAPLPHAPIAVVAGGALLLGPVAYPGGAPLFMAFLVALCLAGIGYRLVSRARSSRSAMRTDARPSP